MNRLACALAVTALALFPTATRAQTAGSTTPETQAKETQAAGLQMTPAQFVQQAAQSGTFEVQSGQLAATKARSQEVKDFAQRMVDDHTRTNDDLKQIAQRKNMEVPTSMAQQHQTMLDTLNNLSGRDFETQYIQGQVQTHQQAVQMFEQQASQSQDADLKTFASSHLPSLRDHLQRAQNLAGQGTPTARQ
ncbi:MAG TPA: DUF4142 domain-containing protein [Azospirillaceae bacterium]|nr:DUF4142 domain-containing protein [Azospirillaceae bacterium]